MVQKQSLEEFLNSLASKKPAPGGGTAAAVAGAIAAALVLKVINLTLGKEKYKEVEKEFNLLKPEAQALLKSLKVLAKKDEEAYLAVVAAKGSQKSILKAAQVPLKTAQNSLKVLKIAKEVSEKGNPNLRSDAFCAQEIARAAVYGALKNVRVNLLCLEEKKTVENLRDKIKKVLIETNALAKI